MDLEGLLTNNQSIVKKVFLGRAIAYSWLDSVTYIVDVIPTTQPEQSPTSRGHV